MAFKDPDPTRDYHDHNPQSPDFGSHGGSDYNDLSEKRDSLSDSRGDRNNRATGYDSQRDRQVEKNENTSNIDGQTWGREYLDLRLDLETGRFVPTKNQSPNKTEESELTSGQDRVFNSLSEGPVIRVPENHSNQNKEQKNNSDHIDNFTRPHRIENHEKEQLRDSTRDVDKYISRVSAAGSIATVAGGALIAIAGGPATALAAIGWSLFGLGFSGSIAAGSMGLASASIKVSEGNYSEASKQAVSSMIDLVPSGKFLPTNLDPVRDSIDNLKVIKSVLELE